MEINMSLIIPQTLERPLTPQPNVLITEDCRFSHNIIPSKVKLPGTIFIVS